MPQIENSESNRASAVPALDFPGRPTMVGSSMEAGAYDDVVVTATPTMSKDSGGIATPDAGLHQSMQDTQLPAYLPDYSM